MVVAIAFVILSGVVIVPTLTGAFLRGPGRLLGVVGAVLVLPLVYLWSLYGASLAFDFTIKGDPWRGLIQLLLALVVGAVGAIIGGFGRAMARRQGP